jgi:hypothetical protein
MRSLSDGDRVVYKHPKGWRPAEYLGRHGSKHIIRVRIPRGANATEIRYVPSSLIAEPDLPIDAHTAVIPGASHG